MDLNYLAGFIDGEGSFGIYKNKNCFVFHLSIANTNLQILEKIQKEYGGKIHKTIKKGKYKTIYYLCWWGLEAVELSKKIKDKLEIKNNKQKFFHLLIYINMFV